MYVQRTNIEIKNQKLPVKLQPEVTSEVWNKHSGN